MYSGNVYPWLTVKFKLKFVGYLFFGAVSVLKSKAVCD